MSKRILVISYHFFPDPAVGAKRPTELAKTLKQEGWEVDVFTKYIGSAAREKRKNDKSFGKIYSLYQHPGIINPIWMTLKRFRGTDKASGQMTEGGLSEPETRSAESLKFRLKRYIISAQSILDASKSWVWVSLLLLLYLKVKRRKYDAVLSSSPISSAHLIGLAAKTLFHARWIADIRDPITMWSEVSPVCRSAFRFRIENYLEKKYYRAADLIVVTSPSLKSELCDSLDIDPTKVHLIYNGYDGKLKSQRSEWNDQIQMIYAGAIYLNRNPFPVFEAIKELIAEGTIRKESIILDLFGDCETWKGHDLVGWVRDNGLEDIICFHGNVSAEELDPHLHNADILLNLAQGQKKQIPAKTFEYLKFRAVQFLVAEPDSDISRFLSENDFGVVAGVTKAEIKQKLAATISEIKSSDALIDLPKKDGKEEYSRENQNKKYTAVIDDAV